MNRTVTLVFALSLGLHGSAVAGTLTVVGEAGVVWNGGASPTLTLRLANDTETEEFVLSYRLGLRIVPDGAIGSLHFASASRPTDGYIFSESVFPPGLSSIVEDEILDFEDAGWDPTTIIPAESFNLISLTFQSGGGVPPAGKFNIELMEFGDTDLFAYYASFASAGNPAEFANAAAGSLVVASVVVAADTPSVPEPHGVASALIGILFFILFRRPRPLVAMIDRQRQVDRHACNGPGVSLQR